LFHQHVLHVAATTRVTAPSSGAWLSFAAPAQPNHARPNQKCTSCYLSGSRLPRIRACIRTRRILHCPPLRFVNKCIAHSPCITRCTKGTHPMPQPDLYLVHHTQSCQFNGMKILLAAEDRVRNPSRLFVRLLHGSNGGLRGSGDSSRFCQTCHSA